MSGSDSHRIPPNRVGLSLILLLVAWLAFSFYPRDKTPPPAAPPPEVESKLRAVGLRDNLDWEGLPEFFAIWADWAEWSDRKTRFAYWHPVMKTYSYYFEATRIDGGYRFKEIPEPKDDMMVWSDQLGDEVPIQFYVYDPELKLRVHPHEHPHRDGSILPRSEPDKLPIDLPQKTMGPQIPEVSPPVTKRVPDKK